VAVVGLGRASAAMLGGGAAAVLVAMATVLAWPDARGLERLYAGVFIGTAAWLAAIFVALLAASGARAWGRVLALATVAAAVVLLHGGWRL
jgi:hypothetical protein